MNKLLLHFIFVLCCLTANAQGWPSNYKGVMLQGFSWDSFIDTQWSNLEQQAEELSPYFTLIWVPQSGNCNTTYNSMGYMPVYYFNQNSSFGTEAQLRSMISAFARRGTGIIADVVINHRNNLGISGSWVDYPTETYNGVTYQMTPKDIVDNDDHGKTHEWATQHGYTLGNNDEGEDWDGCRDLDHTSTNVQTVVKAYLKFLTHDLGYAGFRYDMVKGFASSHVGEYNQDAVVSYSVGEYWDGLSPIKAWINGTGKRSSAFDFPFRYTVSNAINNNDWSRLNGDCLIKDAEYRRYAVTFVENHDMQERGTTSDYYPDPIRRDTLAANAYMLAMPGTPCVFLPHWKAYKSDIKPMIDARNLAEVTNSSSFTVVASSNAYHSIATQGNKASLVCTVGNTQTAPTPDATRYTEILSGYHYKYFLEKTAETAWVAIPSGVFEHPFDVTLTAISQTANASLIYTLDGSEPSLQNGTSVPNGTSISINKTCTLKVALLANGTTTKAITRFYTLQSFEPHSATVYLKKPNWNNVYFYAWANDGKNTQLLSSWPGTLQTNTVEKNGSTWYSYSFNINKADYSFNIIFNQGSGQSQTIDIGPISQDTYYEIGPMVNGKFTVNNITATTTPISPIVFTSQNAETTPINVYTIHGQLIRKNAKNIKEASTGLPKGVYIMGRKKVVIP